MVRTQNKSLIPEIEYDSPRSWIRLILLFIVGVVGTVGMWSVVVVMPALETEFGIDRGKASLLYATTMVGFGLGNCSHSNFNFLRSHSKNALELTIKILQREPDKQNPRTSRSQWEF